MKNKTVLLFIAIALICLILGIIDKLVEVKLLVRSYTWHELTQTFLLFGIAWGIGHNLYRDVKEK
jgi:uncharacterized ion transporter superfamily protein YfcC